MKYVDPDGRISVDLPSLKSTFGDGYAVDFSFIYDQLQRAAQRPKCKAFFQSAYGADITQLVAYGFGPKVFFGNLAGRPGRVRYPTDEKASYNTWSNSVTVDSVFYKSSSSEEIARKIIHELAHYAADQAQFCGSKYDNQPEIHERAFETDDECFE